MSNRRKFVTSKRGHRERRLTPAETKVVDKSMRIIQDEHRKIQEYLSSLNLDPVGGWKDPSNYTLVTGVKLSADCDDCSVVCFDGGCDCQQCTCMQDGNVKSYAITRMPPDRGIFVETFGREGFGIDIKKFAKKR
jgi:hypothetical protein